MDKRISKSECAIWYSKFLHSEQNIVDFCTENSIPYLPFADYINKHENRYGVQMVETAMERTELARYDPEALNGCEIPARGESLFQELALELDSKRFRSKSRFPNNPSFQVEFHAMGRKNYLFCWNELNAERTCIIYSVIESCKLSKIDPYKYLCEIFTRIPKFGETWDDLLPCNIKM